MIRGRQCHVFVNCHNRSPSRRRHTMSVRLGTSGLLSCLDRFGSTSSNKYQCFFFLLTWTSDGCHGGGGRPATDRRAAAAAAPSFINVHHLNVIRHPVALVRVDTIRLSSLKFQSWDHLDSTFEALKRLIKNNCTYSGVQMISHHRLSGNVAFHSISWELQ